jgi:hypothetical protein
VGTEVYLDDTITHGGVMSTGTEGSSESVSFINLNKDAAIDDVISLTSEGPSTIASETGDLVLSGPPVIHDLPPHLQAEASLFQGTVSYTPDEDTVSQATGGWFWADNEGIVLPGVTMEDNVLSGTNLFVNGQPYTPGQKVHGWYYLVTINPISTAFETSVPCHSLTFSTSPLTAVDILSLYSQFFGNPKVSLTQLPLSVTDSEVRTVQSEWSINTSG